VNAVGTGSFSAVSAGVTPAGVPGAQAGVAGTAGNTQVALTWTAPTSTGGSTITGYQVQVATSATGPFNNAAGCGTTSTTPSCTADGQSVGKGKIVQVGASKTVGSGRVCAGACGG